jgi:hypothetical protein
MMRMRPSVFAFVFALIASPAAAQPAPTVRCAPSFTNFVVKRIGALETIGLMPLIPEDGVLPRIEKLAGANMAALRKQWRAAIAPK